MPPKGVKNRRAMAIGAIAKWLETGVFPEKLIPPGEPFALECTYGVLRNLRALELAVGRFAKKKPKGHLHAALLVGAWQILYSGSVPGYAAVSETVEGAHFWHCPKALVNAVLRNILRSKEDILNCIASSPPAVRLSHPDAFFRRIDTAFGLEKAVAIMEGGNSVPCVHAAPLPYWDGELRSMLLERWHGDASLAAYGETLQIRHGTKIGALYGYKEGLFAIQDPATLLSVKMLSVKEGETVFDLCSAPGGKTMQIASSLRKCGSGKVYAFDISEGRMERLKENIERTALGQYIAMAQADAASPDFAQKALEISHGTHPDAVLADVPCSNSGVFRRRADARWRWSEEETRRLSLVQRAILGNAAKLGASRVAYSTCSIDPEEDEEVVKWFLASDEGREYFLEREEKLLPSTENDGAYCALLRRCL